MHLLFEVMVLAVVVGDVVVPAGGVVGVVGDIVVSGGVIFGGVVVGDVGGGVVGGLRMTFGGQLEFPP